MQAQSPARGKFTVALWHPPGIPAPDRLLTALRTKGIETIDTDSAYATLAEACMLRTTPPAADGKRPGSGVVVVFPEQLEDAPTLLEALWRYAPGTRCWAYGPVANPRLTPIVEKQESEPSAERAPAAAEPPRPASPAPPGTVRRPSLTSVEPKLKLTEPEAISIVSDASDNDGEDEEEPRSRRPLLSAEELSMLLGEDDADEGNA